MAQNHVPETQALRQSLERQYTQSEAMYMFDGEALKGSAMIEVSANMSAIEIKKNLMTLDLRFDTLAEYLSNFSTVVNQHAGMLNAIRDDVALKATKKEVGGSFRGIAKAHKHKDKQLINLIKMQERLPKDDVPDNIVKDGKYKMVNKMDQLVTAIDLLFGQNQEIFDRVEKVERKTQDLEKTKADLSYVNQKNDILISLVHEKADEVQKLCFGKIDENYQKTREEIEKLWLRVTECEKNTIQRISDCEQLLKQRASITYVDTQVTNVTKKLEVSLSSFNQDNQLKIEDWRRSTDESVKLLRDELNLRMKEFRELIVAVENNCNSRVDYNRFEDVRKVHITKIEEMMLKFKEHEKKFSSIEIKVQEGLGKYKEKFDKFEDKVEEQISEMKKKIQALEELLKNGDFGKGKGGDGNSDLLALLKAQFQNETKDPDSEYTIERIVKLEREILVLRDISNKNNAVCINLQTDIANKIDLATFTTSLGKKVDRDELLDIMGKMGQDDQKIKNMEKEVLKMKKKLNESIETLDKKIKKLRADLDVTFIQKILQGKANSLEVKSEVTRLDDNYKDAMGLFNLLRSDFENLVVSFKKIAQYIAGLQDDSTTGTLASTKQVLCLSCGRGGPKFVPERKQIMGNDGNYYFSDGVTGHDHSHSPDRNYKTGAEVFDRVQGVMTHTKCNHGETSTLPGQSSTLKKDMANKSTTSFKYRRPQSAQPGIKQPQTNAKAAKQSVVLEVNNSVQMSTSRPQTAVKREAQFPESSSGNITSRNQNQQMHSSLEENQSGQKIFQKTLPKIYKNEDLVSTTRNWKPNQHEKLGQCKHVELKDLCIIQVTCLELLATVTTS